MLGQPFDHKHIPGAINIPNHGFQINQNQRIAMSYPPNLPIQNHLHVQHKQQNTYQKEPPQVPHVALYPNAHARTSIPGQMPGSEIKDNVGGPYMQVYNYGTQHLVQEKQQQQNRGQEHEQQQNSQDEDPEAQQQQVLLFWEHKFFTIFERFQIIHEKVEWMRTQFYNLNNQLKAVDSETEWNMAKQHHDDYMEQIQEFSQELAGVLNQNIALYEQQERQNDQSGIWRQRYYELFQSYKNLQMEAAQLREAREAGGMQHDEQEVNQVIEAYRQLERQYTSVMNELTELKQSNNDNEQLINYRQRLDYTLSEAQKYKQILQKLHEENQQMNNQILELKQENQNLRTMKRTSEYNNAKNGQQNNNLMYSLQSKDEQISQLAEQVNNIQHEYQKMMEQREQNQGYLYNQTQNLERELERRSRQIEIKTKEIQAKNKEIDQKNRQLRQSDMIRFTLQDLQSKNKSLQLKLDDSERMIRNRNNEIEDKNDEIRQKTNQVRDKVKQIQKLKTNISSMQSKLKQTSERELLRKEYDLRLKNIENQYDEKIASLKKIIKQKQEDSELNALTIIKLQTLQKKNKLLLKQIQKLGIEIVDKEKELFDLRRSHYEGDRMKHLQIQYNNVVDDKQNLAAILLQKNFQIDNLQNKLNEFEERVRQIGDRSMSMNSKSLITQIEELNNLIHLKEAEIIKLKSSLNLKEDFINQLQSDMQKFKKKTQIGQIQFEKEKNMLVQKIKDLQKKNQDIEKRTRQLQYDYGTQMKKNLEDEIRVLRNQNQAKQEQIARLQVNEMQLQGRLAHFERIRGTVDSDIDQMATRIRQLQSSKIEMIKKVETSYREVKKKDKQIKDYIQNQKFLKMGIADLENQQRETENMAKEKQKIIDDLESQLMITNTRLTYLTEEHERLRMRRRDETDVFIKESDDLKRKLYEFQVNPIKNSTQNDSLPDKIKRLEQEKQFLKNQLAIALEQIGQVPHFKHDGVPGSSSRKSKISKGVQGIDYIQKRLFEFNSKIDDMIKKNKELNYQNAYKQPHGRKSANLSRQETEQIKTLKEQIQNLRKYCAKLQVEANGQTIRPNPKYSMIFVEQEKAMAENFNFYKKQTEDLELRISKLLQINSSLKERVDSLLRSHNKSQINILYEEQISEAEKTIENLEKRMQKCVEQNRALKANNQQGNMKMCREYEDRIFQCENKIFDLERKIVTLEVQKSKSQSSRLTLYRDYNASKSTLETTVKKLAKHEKQNSQLSNQIRHLENETSELLSKLRVAESQKNRLSQAMQSPYSQHNILLSTPNKTPIRS